MAEVIDRTALEDLREATGNDAGFLDDLVDTFLSEARGHLTEMRAAVETDSAGDLLRPAHTLKSNALNLGAVGLAAISRELEEQARAGSLDRADERVAAAEAEFERVEAALAATRAGGWTS